MKIKWKQYGLVILGTFLVALAFNLFLSPYNLVSGGVSGLAIIMNNIFFIKESVFIFIANFFSLFISLRFLGHEKTKNTILGCILLPIFISLTENITDLLVIENLEPFIAAIMGGCITGLGYGFVFKNNFTTGGTDVINQMVEKYKKVPMGKSILYVDGPIVLLGYITFGFSNMLYSVIVLFLVSVLSNSTMLQLNKNRVMYIKTTKIEEIKAFLIQEFHYDVTVLDTVGGYSKEKTKMIICTVHNKNYYQIKEGISVIDPNVFITVTKSYEQKNANKTLRKDPKLTLNEKEC